MGCGVSKMETNGGATLSAKLRPLFLRRLEEIKLRRHAQPLKDSTPSKKELLLHDRDEDDVACHQRLSCSDYDTLRNVTSTTKDGSDLPKNEPSASINSTISVEKFENLRGKDRIKPYEKTSKKSNGATCDNKAEMLTEFSQKIRSHNEKKDQEMKGNKTKIENTSKDADGSNDEDGEYDKGRRISRQDDDAFPGSPSFRIYFTDRRDDDQYDNIGNNDTLRDAGASDDKTSLKELPVKKDVKRGRKIQSFRKVLPKGGQSTVKNLLNVKSCYNPSHSSHDRPNLLTAKTV